MKKLIISFLCCIFLFGCSCNNNSKSQSYSDDYYYDSDSSDMVYEVVEDTTADYESEDVASVPNRTEIGKWEIVKGYNLVIWKEDNYYYCAAETNGKLDEPGCRMEHITDADGRHVFSFVFKEDGDEIYTIMHDGTLFARYVGETSGTFYNSVY